MLRSAVSLVTGFGVLWHVVVGCCAHHRHDEPAAIAAASAHDETVHAVVAKPHACCRASHRHEHSHAHIETPHRIYPAETSHPETVHQKTSHDEATHDVSSSAPGQQPAEPCDGVACSFLPAQFVHPADYTPHVPAMTSSSPPEISGALAPAGFGGALVARGDDRPPPLRSHLALGVLLI